MSGENVENFFESPDSGGDNTLVVGGTFITGAGTNMKTKTVVFDVGDLTTADSHWIIPGFPGTVQKVGFIVNNTFGGSDASIALHVDGGTAMGGLGTLIIDFSGSAAGDFVQANATSLNVITETSSIQIQKAAGVTGTVEGTVTIEILLN